MAVGFCNADKSSFPRTAGKVCFSTPICKKPNLIFLGSAFCCDLTDKVRNRTIYRNSLLIKSFDERDVGIASLLAMDNRKLYFGIRLGLLKAP